MAGSLAQFIETAAFGVLNDVLSGFHSQNGYAVPNRFEAVIIPPTGIGRNSSSTFLQKIGKISQKCAILRPWRKISPHFWLIFRNF